MNGCRRAMAAAGRDVPLQVQVTIELTGRMLPGTEMSAAIAALDPLGPDVLGINCATGPAEMGEHLRVLSAAVPACRSRASPTPACRRWSTARCTTTSPPTSSPTTSRRYVTELGVSVIGGCCGTTPEHLVGARRPLRRRSPRRRATPAHEPGATSIYSLVPFDQDTSFLIIGERTNANGSKKFREAMLDGDLDTCLQMATRPGRRRRPRARCLRRLRRPRRHGRHGRARLAIRHPGRRAAGARLDRARGHGGRAAPGSAAGRSSTRRTSRTATDQGSRLDRVFAPRQGVRRRGDLPADRRGGPGPRRRVEDAHRPPASTTSPSIGTASKPRDLIFDALTFPLSHRRRRPAARRHRHDRGHPSDQGRAARDVHHARRLQRVVRSQARRPPRPQLGVPPRVRRGRSRLGHRPRGAHHAAQPDPRRAARRLPRPDLGPARHRPAATAPMPRYDPLAAAARRVRRRGGDATVEKEDRSDWPVERAPRAPHHRRRPRRPRPTISTWRWRGHAGARHRQRHPPRAA